GRRNAADDAPDGRRDGRRRRRRQARHRRNPPHRPRTPPHHQLHPRRPGSTARQINPTHLPVQTNPPRQDPNPHPRSPRRGLLDRRNHRTSNDPSHHPPSTPPSNLNPTTTRNRVGVERRSAPNSHPFLEA